MEGEARDGNDRGTVESVREVAGELGVGDRIGGSAVDRTADRFILNCEEDEVDPVVDVDPGHPLFAGPEAAADPVSERRKHLGQHSAIGAEDETGAETNDADAERFGEFGGLFPGSDNAGQEVIAGIRVFGENLIATRSVDADGRRIDQNLRPAGLRGEGVDELACSLDAGVANPLFDFGSPALRDRFAGEMDDSIGGGECWGGRFLAGGFPFREPSGGGKAGGAMTAQEMQRVALGEEFPDEARTEESGCSSEGDVHVRLCSCYFMCATGWFRNG